MRYKYIPLIIVVIGIGGMIYAAAIPRESNYNNIQLTKESSADKDEDFNTMMDVVTHKRCMNCHPSGNRPRQGEDGHIHYFNVQRGTDGHGIGSLQCVSCHRDSNNETAGIPGAPHWHISPRSMAWEGLTRTEIATSFLDKNKNGDKSLDEIVKHMTEDAIVLWAFDPGVDNEGIAREKPQVSKEKYIAAVKKWADGGAIIPKNK